MSFNVLRNFVKLHSLLIGSAYNKGIFLDALNQSNNLQINQVRTHVEWRMAKDMKRRKLVAEYAFERARLKTIRKNTILPVEMREKAFEEQEKLPLNSRHRRIVNRCVLTSRPRGNVPRWRMSRFEFRHNADYNKLSGVIRAIW